MSGARKSQRLPATFGLAESEIATIDGKSLGRCWYCGLDRPDDRRARQSHWTYDHQQPQSQGGETAINNIVLACRRCNSSKRQDSLEQFRARVSLVEAGVPTFSPIQRDWLRTLGFTLKIPVVRFYGEGLRRNLQAPPYDAVAMDISVLWNRVR
jgi:hypothetical protein